jgi:plastocyanin
MTPRTASALAVTLLLAAGCGSNGSKPAHASVASQQRVNDGGTFDARGATTVQVTATDFRFSPSTILGTPGQRLTLVVHNTSQTPHNVTASSAGVDQDLAPGTTQRVTLTVPASGQLVFVCSFHAASGMAGRVETAGSAAASPAPTSPAASSSGSGAGNGYGSSGYGYGG